MLLALNKEEPPKIEAVDKSERARRGVDGLISDVWPSLCWGMTHTSLLRTRLDQLRQQDVYNRSISMASRYLPKRVTIDPVLYVVMGGRAGAAASENGDIYFDILASSYRSATGRLEHYPTVAEQR